MTRMNCESHILNNSLHLIGSRRHGVNEDDSDYDYLLIVPESKVPDTLSLWRDADIIEYTNIPDLSAIFPIDIGYRIKGISNEDTANILSTPVGILYDVLVIPRPDRTSDSSFILENVSLYRMLKADNAVYASKEVHSDLKDRVKTIRLWAKNNNVYGGAYPDGTGYFIYTMNTMKKGYSCNKSLHMLYTRCLYYCDEYKYRHISYVAEKSLKHIYNILCGTVKKGSFQYQVMSNRMEEVLRLSKKLLDETPTIMYIENSGIIHSSSDTADSIEKWSEWLQSLGIDNRIVEMK